MVPLVAVVASDLLTHSLGSGRCTSPPTSAPPAHAGVTPTRGCHQVKQERTTHPPS